MPISSSPIALRTIYLRATADKVKEKEHSFQNNLVDISNKNRDLNSPPRPSIGEHSSSNLSQSPPQEEKKKNGLRARRGMENLEKFQLNDTNVDLKKSAEKVVFLKMISDQIGIDEYNKKQCEVLFDRLYDMKSELEKNHSENYQSVKNSRYERELKYCKDTLIKSNGIYLPANNVSADDSRYMTIASQYPFNNKESLRSFFNMLFDNDINTVYILASNDDIKKDLSKLGSEYNKKDFETEGFKYFREGSDSDDIKSSLIRKWDFSKVKIQDKDGTVRVVENKNGENDILGNKTHLDCKVYSRLFTKKGCKEDKTINFVHIFNWKDHTGIDATKLQNTINVIGDKLKITPTKENIAVHCLAGLGRTGEFIALMEMMKMIEAKNTEAGNTEAGNTEEKSLESIIADLRKKRSIRALYKPEQIAELAKFAINNIPLLNNDIKTR
ncbi:MULTISPECIES: protein-tyrosine phosphatase family protein [Enterobacterales]|uniref:protein-tyrosine phosphatase family protein n=1 Tax=Enterobacterales TaxID=91347 RepID=UPI000AC96A4D|nr:MULTISPECIES: protein-tyrosine phosphatase family protein [Enterobacterales]WOO49405.1 protein-tyrosine phosphatase family protein [Hafnia alvei]WPF03871.1 protein-tyrosine phosphatase family protein [Proteus vulgaris]